MPYSSAVKMLDPFLSCHDFATSMAGMKIAHEEDEGILETESSVYAIMSGGPIWARRELKIDATAIGLVLAWFFI